MKGKIMREESTLSLLLKELRLPTMVKHWEEVAQRYEQQPLKFLAQLCEMELSDRLTKRIAGYIKKSNLPLGKNFSSFDFSHINSNNKAQIEPLIESTEWINQAENILIFGGSGVGKSHLASAIGYKAIEQGVRVYFSETSKLVQQLQLARKELQMPKVLARLSRYPLLILDDIGYVKKDEGETNVLFELIADRYESGSLIITANQPFSEWDSIFPSNMMAVAAIDRLVHHASIIKIDADSYRKNHAKSKDSLDLCSNADIIKI